MLWGLEALRVFDDRLSASLSEIQKAKEAMERTIKQECDRAMLQEYNDVIEEFEKRYGMLSDVQVRTQLKIRQVTGLRDGVSKSIFRKYPSSTDDGGRSQPSQMWKIVKQHFATAKRLSNKETTSGY